VQCSAVQSSTWASFLAKECGMERSMPLLPSPSSQFSKICLRVHTGISEILELLWDKKFAIKIKSSTDIYPEFSIV
jgi:hypothetical protein